MQAFLGRRCAGWAWHPWGVGDRERGQQPAGGAQRGGDEHSGPESCGERIWVQVGRAGDAGQRGQHGDGQQAAEPGRIVLWRGKLPGGRRRLAVADAAVGSA